MNAPFSAAFYLMHRLHTVGALTFGCGSSCDERAGSTYDGLCLAYNERAYEDRTAERKARYRREAQEDAIAEWAWHGGPKPPQCTVDLGIMPCDRSPCECAAMVGGAV